MKKVFSLICLFIFMFFGVVNTALASTGNEEPLDIDNVVNRFEGLLKTNEDVSVSRVYFEDNQLIVAATSGTNFIFNYDGGKYQFSYNGTAIPVAEANKYLIYMRTLFNAVMLEHGFTSEQISDVRNKTKGVSSSGHTIYNIEGLFYYEGAQYVDEDTSNKLVNFTYSISLASTLKTTAEDILNNDQTGDSGTGDSSDDTGTGDGLDDFEDDDGSDDSGNSGGETDDSGNSGGETGDSDNTGTGTGTGEKPEDNVDTSDISVGNLLLIGGCLLLITGYGIVKLKKIK